MDSQEHIEYIYGITCFSFMDRIRILFGKKAKTTITVNLSDFNKSNIHLSVEPIFKKTYKLTQVTPIDNERPENN